MTVRPIIFSAPMVRALLDGRKTQTRRVLKEQNSIADPVMIGGRYQWKGWKTGCILGDVAIPYAPGDLLWVREAFRGDQGYDATPPREWSRWPVSYEADPFEARSGLDVGRLRSPIHMPRWASRLTLRVTDVRVQRVQDITLGDCWAEGCETARDLIGAHAIPKGAALPFKEFRELWDSIQAKARTAAGWKANPWVCALTFDVIRANVDSLP